MNESIKINDIVFFQPFKTDDCYIAKILDIKENEDKPYLLQLDTKNIWAYPIEVMPIKDKKELCNKCTNKSFKACQINRGPDGNVLMPLDDNGLCVDFAPEEKQVKHNFQIGDNIWYGTNKAIINNIHGNMAYVVYDHGAEWVKAYQLQPYIEPNYKFEIGEKVIFRNNKIKIVRKRYASPYDNLAHYSVTTLDMQSPINVIEDDLLPYNESVETTKTMQLSGVKDNIDNYFNSHSEEEIIDTFKKHGMIEDDNNTKEDKKNKLNLCKLLGNYKGYHFFSLLYGDVELNYIEEQQLSFKNKNNTIQYITSEGFDHEGESKICLIYPSLELYKKYPLDAKAAWDEWININDSYYELTINWHIHKKGDPNMLTNSHIFHIKSNYKFYSEKEALAIVEDIKNLLKSKNI